MAKELSHLSSRHHYIPQFYIKGFTDSQELLYVYKKTRDCIERNKGAKGVFYKKDPNTIIHNCEHISIIEDYTFSKTDDSLAKMFAPIGVLPNDGSLMNDTNRAVVKAMIVELFWRNPANDPIYNEMHGRATVNFRNVATGEMYQDSRREEQYKKDPMFKMIGRAGMSVKALQDIGAKKLSGWGFSKFWTFEKPVFVISDYPILFRKPPESHQDLFAGELYLPITHSRLYATHQFEGTHLTESDTPILNALLIAQSSEMVCSPSLQLLENAINCYKKIKQTEMLAYHTDRIFRKVAT